MTAYATLLDCVNQAAARLGIPQTTQVIGSNDSQILQLLSLANEEGQTCTDRFDWSFQVVDQTFSTLAQHEQTDALPDDFDHIINESMWDRTTVRKVFGPLTAEQWQNEMAFPVYTPIAPAYFIKPNNLITDGLNGLHQPWLLCLTPVPAAGDTLAFSYKKNSWCIDLSANGIIPADWLTSYNGDTYGSIFGGVLTVKGLIWRFKKMKGLAYGDEFNDYEAYINRMYARDGGGKPRLNLAYGLNRRLLYPANIPIGNWPAS